MVKIWENFWKIVKNIFVQNICTEKIHNKVNEED